MLRAFWKKTFIKIDDEENNALKDIVLQRNEEYIDNPMFHFDSLYALKKKIKNRLDERYLMTSKPLLELNSNGDYIKHEMAIEAGIVDILTNRQFKGLFGDWDYVTRQLIASPFKPIDYMDKMDIFGIRKIPGFNTVSKYLMIEIKKDSATKEDIDQAMKYVDWINQEYAHGDYSMIIAFLIAYKFPREVVTYRDEVSRRNFIKGRRPATAIEWENLTLVKYAYDKETKQLILTSI
ncbi:hypothetical protein EU245_09910 [Lentibacillus lipolyticus]|nr:hypothetical protein EU245_09910 [Lentibacillus lipolyticus]